MTTESSALTTVEQPGLAPVSRKFMAALALANFSIFLAFFTPIVLTLPLRIEHLAPDSKTTTFSVLLVISSIFGLVANPITGRLSDRSVSRWGRRRTYLAGGVTVGFAGLVVMALAPDIPILTVGSVLSQIGFAGTVTVLLSLLPEQVPERQRGVAGGLIGLGQAVAVVLGVGIGGALRGSPELAFIVPGLAGLIGVGALCLVLPDRVLAASHREPWRTADLLRAFWRDPRQYPDFGWAWLSRFLFFMALAGIINYQVFYLSDQLGIAGEDSAKYVGIALALQVVMTLAASALSGFFSDRIGRRRPFILIAGLAGAAGLLCIAVATSLPLYLVGMVITGLAQGTYLAVDLALVSQVLPDTDHEAAKDIGVMTIANQLPQTVSPGTAPIFLAIGVGSVAAGSPSNYTALFVASAVFALLSAFAITRVRGVR